MPFRKLQLQPGVNVERSPTLNQTQFAATNLIRFYNGLIQKLGGWVQLTAQTFLGTCRALHGWADIIGNPYLAIGTEQRLDVDIGGTLFDITPLAETTNPSLSFSTVINTDIVTIADSGYNPNVGDWINLLTQVAVGGIVLFGYYQVQTVPSGTTYTILAAANATSTVNNGGAVPQYTTTNSSSTITVALADHGYVAGNTFPALVSTTVATVVILGNYAVVTATTNSFTFAAGSTANAGTSAYENGGDARINYLLPTGYAVNTPQTGYGIGLYGAGYYGTGGSGQITAPMRVWSLDHWGQDLIASPNNLGIYYWEPPSVTPAVVLSNTSPLYNAVVFAMPQIQILVSLGAETGSTQEPLLVRWCDAGDFTDWTATATNQAGSYQLPTGSALLAGLAVGLGALLWTDVDLWSMVYQGLPFVFGFNRIATGCGIISQRAAGISGTLVIWLSTRGFFNYSLGGTAQPMECPVWDFLIDNIDTMQLAAVHCAVNSLFNEMAWHFPVAPSSSIYSTSAPYAYVKVNFVEGGLAVWDYGQSSQYQRTAWTGRSPVGNPIGADLAGLLQQHEIGKDANGVGMQWSWITGYFDVADGEQYPFIDLIIPDNVTEGSPTINYTVYVTDYPYATPTAIGPFAVGPNTNFVPLRARGRQIAIGASGSDLGTFNRLGALRYRAAADGRN